MNETYETVVAILTDRFEADRAAMTPDSTLNDLDLDSLFLVEFALVLQERFAIAVSEDALALSDTLATVAELVDRGRQEAGIAS